MSRVCQRRILCFLLLSWRNAKRRSAACANTRGERSNFLLDDKSTPAKDHSERITRETDCRTKSEIPQKRICAGIGTYVKNPSE